LQADAMVAAGLDLPTDQLAVACASHSGEPQHLEVVRLILSDSGLAEEALANPPARPYGQVARAALRDAGVAPSALQQNCSGKHAAMLATCRVNGWSTDGYLAEDHPLQQSISAHIETLAGEQVTHVGIDGCGAPTHAFSLRGLANAFAALTRPDHDQRVARAMRAHPELVGGTDRDVTRWMQAVTGLIAKEGAAGVMAAALPDGRAVAYKIADGSDVARQAVMPEAMRLLGVDAEVVERLAQETAVPVFGGGGTVGQLVGLEWPGRGWRA
jgi:L-asparaginase II